MPAAQRSRRPAPARHSRWSAGASDSSAYAPWSPTPPRRTREGANERGAAGPRANRRWQQCGVRLPGGGARTRARLATPAAECESRIWLVAATFLAAGMEASRCRLGPGGDRSEAGMAGEGCGWSGLERGSGQSQTVRSSRGSPKRGRWAQVGGRVGLHWSPLAPLPRRPPLSRGGGSASCSGVRDFRGCSGNSWSFRFELVLPSVGLAFPKRVGLS